MKLSHIVNWVMVLGIMALSGCGTGKILHRAEEKIKQILPFGKKGMSEAEMQAYMDAMYGSQTGQELTIFVWIGALLFLIGAGLVIAGFSKKNGLLAMGIGAGSAFVGYAIEEYAAYVVSIGGVIVMVGVVFEFGYKHGRRLGYEQGKDFEQDKLTKTAMENEESIKLTETK